MLASRADQRTRCALLRVQARARLHEGGIRLLVAHACRCSRRSTRGRDGLITGSASVLHRVGIEKDPVCFTPGGRLDPLHERFAVSHDVRDREDTGVPAPWRALLSQQATHACNSGHYSKLGYSWQSAVDVRQPCRPDALDFSTRRSCVVQLSRQRHVAAAWRQGRLRTRAACRCVSPPRVSRPQW